VTSLLRHREKVLAHAEQQLASQGKKNASELLTLYKKFLKIENHRLRLKHYAGGGGREIAQQRANLVDIVLRHLHESALKGVAESKPVSGIALVAIGGYGRGELNPFSDVDIMFLHEAGAHLPPEIGGIIESILYTLWDVGFKVGHSSRSIDEAVRQANADMLSKTALLEARFIAGDAKLFEKFKSEFEKKCVSGHEKEYIGQRVENQANRHLKHGSKVYMQEPNIKNGCGSLRDYQNLLWVSYFKKRITSTSQLVEQKLLPESERRKLDRAYDFLLKVRTELQYLNKRATDSLGHVFQLQVATKLEYPQKNALRRIEAFMRDYYQHARNIFQITETLSAKLCMSEEESARSGLMQFLQRKKKKEHFDGFFIAQGNLYPDTREIFKEDPFRMMRAFQHAQQRNLGFAPELQTLVRRRLHFVDRTYCYARSPRETFKAILSRKGEVGRILRMMHECDFLGRYIPEFGAMTCLVQHEFFHRYTGDEHTLVCIEKLDEIIDTEVPRLQGYRELFKKLEDPFILYLSLLMHDTGKASNARYHAEASALFAHRVAARLQITSDQRKSLIFLVDNHLLLSSTAQRRNVEDPATISEFAAVVRTQSNLDALMLLTLVDGMGVGEHIWSDWKESLVWQMYRNTTRYLKEGGSFFQQRALEREDAKRAVIKKLSADYSEEVNAHFLYMPDSYFQAFDPAAISSHIRLFRAFFESRYDSDAMSLAPAIRWIARPERGHSEVWVCTWDRKNLLAKIAGSLAVAQLNILSADIFTRGDNLVLDIFRVCNTNYQAVADSRETALVDQTLMQAMFTEEFDFSSLLKKTEAKRKPQLSYDLDFPTRISVDNDSHPVYTLVDIQTPDRLGLLYLILKGFSEAGLNIALSRIATEKGAAMDTFYVTDEEGNKLKDRSKILSIQQLLQKEVAWKHLE
jgi:[protein-PII] uridylyltransferase